MTEFDDKYVGKLREEAASWRTKYRELEAQNLYKDVEVEFAKRGITADPTWVEVSEGSSVKEAVDALVSKHPNLAPTIPTPTQPTGLKNDEVARPTRPQAPKVMSTGATSPEGPANPFHERGIQEVKKDPVARSKLRDQYRSLLASTSNQPDHEY